MAGAARARRLLTADAHAARGDAPRFGGGEQVQKGALRLDQARVLLRQPLLVRAAHAAAPAAVGVALQPDPGGGGGLATGPILRWRLLTGK